MRPLALLSLSPVLLGLVALAGCTRDNPAFDECDGPDRCLADASGTTEDPGDGDGDPGDGDGAPGDGDGAPGDGDGDPGDGDGDPGDGDGDPGDGDGDGDDPNALPLCPQTQMLYFGVVEDTFLVAGPEELGDCVVGYDEQGIPILSGHQKPCDELEFGGAPFHWVCNSPECRSIWLGRFNPSGYAEQAPVVTEAWVDLHFDYFSPEPITVILRELISEPSLFGNCGDWQSGAGWGDPPALCDTTFMHSAFPTPWIVEQQVINANVLSQSVLTTPQLGYNVKLPVPLEHAQSWLDEPSTHDGVFVVSTAYWPEELQLIAKGNPTGPVLVVKACTEG